MRHEADNMSLGAGARVGSIRTIRRSVCSLGACLTVFLCSLVVVASAQAGTGYVDGISDQSMPSWDGGFSGNYFASFFDSTWVNPPPHIAYARYVVQWNVMYKSTEKPYNEEPYVHYRQQFEEWVNDAAGMGLTLEIAVTEYPGTPYPSSSSEYKSRLKEIINQANAQGHPISYLEPWNEPNGQGKETEVAAAHFANEGNAVCKESPKCTVIAGNVEDSSSATKYLTTYRESLNFTPIDWGVHPYQSVEHRELKYYKYFLEGLPNKGVGDHVWFTEVGTRRCTATTENGEIGQAERAKWLVQTLMPSAEPEHVLYWEFLLKNRQQPSCSETDDALYVPSSDPNAPDAPRPAAAFVDDDSGVPWGYTGAGTVSTTEPAAVLTASIYPGGFLNAEYYFEYGITTLYGSYSTKGNAGSGSGGVAASLPVEGLAPATTYHYRVIARNTEGLREGMDRTLTTPSEPSATTGKVTNIQQFQSTLSGTVDPNGADTHYYFEYGTTTGYGSVAPAWPGNDIGSGSTPLEVNTTITGLLAGTTYHYRVVASSWAGTHRGSDEQFTTESTTRPTAVLYPNGDQYVYYRSTNNQLYFWLWNASKETWTLNWKESESHPMAGEPTAVLYPNGNQYVYYRGTNNQLYFWLWNASKETWTLNWKESESHPMAGEPTAVLYPNGSQYVYFGGTNGEPFFWLWNANNEEWTLNWKESSHLM
jgi:hypothetical protein